MILHEYLFPSNNEVLFLLSIWGKKQESIYIFKNSGLLNPPHNPFIHWKKDFWAFIVPLRD